VKSTSLVRAVVAIFLIHVGTTLALGYLVLPQFESIDRPSVVPAPAPVLAGIVRAFYFPLITWATDALASGPARPDIWFVVLNSLVVASFLAGLLFLAWPRKRAVA